jgi:hypothetical protein
MKSPSVQMHQIVLALTGIMSAFFITFPISMLRVSSTEKFAGQPFNSQTCETYNPKQRQVVSWRTTCFQMSVAPLAKRFPTASTNPKAAGIPAVAKP